MQLYETYGGIASDSGRSASHAEVRKKLLEEQARQIARGRELIAEILGASDTEDVDEDGADDDDNTEDGA